MKRRWHNASTEIPLSKHSEWYAVKCITGMRLKLHDDKISRLRNFISMNYGKQYSNYALEKIWKLYRYKRISPNERTKSRRLG